MRTRSSGLNGSANNCAGVRRETGCAPQSPIARGIRSRSPECSTRFAPTTKPMSGALSRLVAEAGQPDIVISALPSEARRQAIARAAVQGRAPAASGGSLRARRASAVPGRQCRGRVYARRAARATTPGAWPRWCANRTCSNISICCRRRDSIPRPSRWRRSRWPRCSRAQAKRQRRQADRAPGGRRRRRVHLGGAGRSRRNAARDALGERRPDDVRRCGGLAGRSRADSQLGASDIARAWRGRSDQTEVIIAGAAAAYPKVRGMLSDSLAMSVRDGGAFDYTGAVRGHGAEQQASIRRASRCCLGELPDQAARSDQFSPGRVSFSRPRARRSQPVLHFGDAGRRAVGRAGS